MNPEFSEKASPPPAWLRWFVSDAAMGILDQGSLAPIGCHYFHDSDNGVWEVTLFSGQTEVVGGPRDGVRLGSGLQVDILQTLKAFDSAPDCFWQSESVQHDDELGNHLSLEGIARGHRVWLRILHNAPSWSGVSRVLHAGQGMMEDLW